MADHLSRPLIHQHAQYISDPTMMEPYARAIARVVKSGDVVLDVGAGTGILGYLACQAGASRVYAIESADILTLAREIAAANGYGDRVVPVRGASFDVDLPVRADVAIVSMLARFGVEDGILPTVLDLKERLLEPGARFVPAAVSLWTAPAEIPEWYEATVAPWLHPVREGSYGAVARAAAARISSANVAAAALLAEPVAAASLEFATLDSDAIRCHVTHSVVRAGQVHAVAGWSAWRFGDHDLSGNRPGGRNTWGQILFPFDRPVPVEPGDVVALDLDVEQTSTLSQRWMWTVRARHSRTGEVTECHGERLDRGDVDANPGDTMPVAAVADILELFDGRRTVQAIADVVMERHRTAFRSPSDAVRTVAALSRRWSA